MLNTRLDALGKNDGVRTACVTHGSHVGSDGGGVRDGIDRKRIGCRLHNGCGKTLAAPGYMCVNMHAYRLEANRLRIRRWPLQHTRFLAHAPSLPPSLPPPLPRCPVKRQPPYERRPCC